MTATTHGERSASGLDFVWVTYGKVTHLAGQPGWTGNRRPLCGQRVDQTMLEREHGRADRDVIEYEDGRVERTGWYGPNGPLCARCAARGEVA